MILVTVGNGLRPFTRMLEAAERAIADARVDDDVLFQTGHATFEPRRGRRIPFLSHAEFERVIRAARVVVTHAGVGTVLTCVHAGKKPLLVPRLKRHGEIVDDHQVQICEELDRRGVAIYVRDLDRLADLLDRWDEPLAERHAAVPEVSRHIADYLRRLAARNNRADPCT